MRNEEYLATWRQIKATALGELEIAGFAIVAVQRDGTVFYGADFSLDEMVRRQIARHLSFVQSDLRATNKALKPKGGS